MAKTVDVQLLVEARLKEQQIDKANKLVNKLQKEIDQTTEALVKLKQQGDKTNFDKLSNKLDIYVKRQQNVRQSIQQTSLEMQRMGVQSKKMQTTSRNANFALQQLGYGIEDANYGFRGIANNVNVLAVALGNLAQDARAKGTTAFKEMTKAIMSPAGIVFGIQVLMSVFILLEKRFESARSKAKKLTNAFADQNKQLIQNTREMEALNRALESNAITTQEGAHAARLLNDELNERLSMVDDEKERLKVIQDYVQELKNEVELEKIKFEFRQKLANVNDITPERRQELQGYVDTYQAMIDTMNETGADTVGSGPLTSKTRAEIEANMKVYVDQLEAYDNQVEKIVSETAKKLEKFLPEDPNDKPDAKGAEVRVVEMVERYASKVFQTEQDILKMQQRVVKETTQSKIEALSKTQKIEKEKEEQSFVDYVQAEIDKADIAINSINRQEKDKLKNKKLTAKQIKAIEDNAAKEREAIENELNNTLEQSTVNHNNKMAQLEITQAAETARIKGEVENKVKLDMLKASMKSTKDFYSNMDSSLKPLGALGEDLEVQNLKDKNAMMLELQTQYNEQKLEQMRLQGATENQIIAAREQMNADLENTRIRNSINETNAEYEAKKSIQAAYANHLQNFGGIMQSIAAEHTALAKAGLIVEKGAAIAKIVTDTIKDNQVITSNAARANMAIDAKYAPLPFGQALATAEKLKISATAKKNKIRNTVSAAKSVATIAATTITSFKKPDNSTGGSTSSGGGVTQVARPNFNILGSTGTNQLADVIATKTSKPVKAYVVASEVTTQQALDRQTEDEATF